MIACMCKNEYGHLEPVDVALEDQVGVGGVDAQEDGKHLHMTPSN